MDKRIIFELIRDEKQVRIAQPTYSILDYEGLESSDYEIVSDENVSFRGSVKKRTRILPRQIILKFAYLGKDKLEERERLISFFSPFRGGMLTVSYQGIRRSIEYEVSSFKYESKSLIEPLIGEMYLECMSPEFLSEVTIGSPIMTLIGGWKWKFTLPFRMKQYGPLKKNIIIKGDMETPVEIYFRGPAINPVVRNHRTGEFVRINRTLTSDETLYINTEYRKKTVEIIRGEEREDAWSDLGLGSKFFWLYPGDNMIEYSMDSKPELTRGVEIYYRERYIGI